MNPLVVILILLIGDCSTASKPEQEEISLTDFDALWDYNDPGKTEVKFRDLLPGEAIGIKGVFRKGGVGNWRNYFSPAEMEIFKKEVGDLLVTLLFSPSP